MRSDVDVTKTMVTGMATGEHLVMGTPGYIAPEVQRGQEATPASDVYSLAVAFFHLLTNVWYDPCLAPNKDNDSLVSMNSVKLLEPFEYKWADVLPRMLDENPSNRPLNLAELPSCILPEKRELPKPKRRGWVKWMAASVAILVLGGVCAWWRLVQKKTPLLLHDLYEIPAATPEE